MGGGAFETHESRVARLAHNAKAARTSSSTPHHPAPALLRGCRALPAEAAQIELQGSEEREERRASQLELPTPAGSLLSGPAQIESPRGDRVGEPNFLTRKLGFVVY